VAGALGVAQCLAQRSAEDAPAVRTVALRSLVHRERVDVVGREVGEPDAAERRDQVQPHDVVVVIGSGLRDRAVGDAVAEDVRRPVREPR